MNRVYSNKTHGFTLVELLVVMLVLVALSSITLDFTQDFAFQGRYEVTKDRYDKIKRAIIGRPDVLINGQPDISGFVADMGRLPRNIQELLVQNYCSDDYRISDNTPSLSGITDATGTTPKEWCTSKTPNGVWHSARCTDATKVTQTTCEAASKIWSSWKGPYLTTTNPDYKPNAFSDGWGNGNKEIALTDHNYGWNYNLVSNEVSFFSYGKDGSSGGGAGTYDIDYPSNPIAISQNNWLVDINSLKVSINSHYGGICSIDTPKYGHICRSINGSWSSPICSINNEYLCTSILNNTWTDTTVPTGVLYCSTSSLSDHSGCTGTWDAGTNTCDAKTDEILVVSSEKLCELSSGTWVGSACLNISKNQCWGNIGSNSWNYNEQNLCISILRNSSSNISLNKTLKSDGREYTIPFGSASNLPIGEAVGLVFDNNTCIDTNDDAAQFTQAHCEADNGGTWLNTGAEKYCNGVVSAACTGTSGTNLHGTESSNCTQNNLLFTYQSGNQESICINTKNHANFTLGNCGTNGGTWVNDGTEQYCDKVLSTDCTGTTSPELGGTLHPRVPIVLVPHSTLSVIRW